MIYQPEIERSLIISTAHINYHTSLMMEDHSLPINETEVAVLCVDNLRYGYRVPLSLLINAPSLTTDLKDILDFAVPHFVDAIIIDRDGPVYEELSTYDW